MSFACSHPLRRIVCELLGFGPERKLDQPKARDHFTNHHQDGIYDTPPYDFPTKHIYCRDGEAD